MGRDADSALRSVTQGAGLVLFGTVLQLGIAFLAKAVMARFLAIDAYGSVSLGIILLNFGATIALLGLDTGIARYLPRFEQRLVERRTIYFSYIITIILSLLITVIVYLNASYIGRRIFSDSSLVPVLRIMAVGIPFWTLLDLGIGVTRGISETAPRIYAKNILLPLGRFLFISLVIVLGYGVLGVAGAYVLSYMLAAILITYLVVRRFVPVLPSVNQQERDLFSFSVPLTFSNLSSLVFRNVDLVLLGIIFGSGQVGVYNVAYPFARLLLSGMGAFGFLFVPVVSSLHAEEKLQEATRVYQLITKWLVVIMTPPFAVMVLFPEMSIKILFGAKYVEGAVTLIVLSVGFYISNLTGLNLNTLTSIGRSRIVMVADTIAMGLNLLLNLVLIPRYGYLGAGIATGLTYLGRDLFGSAVLYYETGIHPFTPALIRPFLFTAVTIALIYVPINLYLTVTLPSLLVLFVLFLLLYGVSMLRLGGIEREDVMMFETVEEYAGIDFTWLRRLLRGLMR